jgi:hypothetical protein
MHQVVLTLLPRYYYHGEDGPMTDGVQYQSVLEHDPTCLSDVNKEKLAN